MEKHPPPKNVTRRAKGHHPLCPDDFQTLAPLPSYRSEREKSNSLPSEHLLSMAKEPSSDAKRHEDRLDWALCYPRIKSAAGQTDYTGVVRLSASGQRFWINIRPIEPRLGWTEAFRLDLTAKDGSGKARALCYLRENRFNSAQLGGHLTLVDAANHPDALKFRIEAWEQTLTESQSRLALHFILDPAEYDTPLRSPTP
jgi:hypothetical protein